MTAPATEYDDDYMHAHSVGLIVQLFEHAAEREVFEDAAYNIHTALKLLRVNERKPRLFSDSDASELSFAVNSVELTARWWDPCDCVEALIGGIPAVLNMIQLRAGKVSEADQPEVLRKFQIVGDALKAFVRTPESVEHDRLRVEQERERARLAKEAAPDKAPEPQSNFAKIRSLPFAHYYNLPATAPGQSQMEASEENMRRAASGEYPLSRSSLAARHFVLAVVNGEHELPGYDPERLCKVLDWVGPQIIEAAPDLPAGRVFESLALVSELAWTLYHKQPTPLLVDQLDRVAAFASELDVLARRQAANARGDVLDRVSAMVAAISAPQGDAALN